MYTTITVLHSKKGLLFQQKAKSLNINCCVHYKVLYKSSDLIFNVKILHPGKPPMSLKFEGKRKMKRLKEKTKEKLNISEKKYTVKRSKKTKYHEKKTFRSKKNWKQRRKIKKDRRKTRRIKDKVCYSMHVWCTCEVLVWKLRDLHSGHFTKTCCILNCIFLNFAINTNKLACGKYVRWNAWIHVYEPCE